MIYSLLLPVHSLKGSKRRNAPICTLAWIPTLPSYDSESASHGQRQDISESEPRNNLVEYEVRGYLTIRFNCRHSLSPFREVINIHYDMMMPPS